jgi:hypothetical protein
MNYKQGLKLLPNYLHQQVIDYIEEGKRPQPFLSAALLNNFCWVMEAADDLDMNFLWELKTFLQSHTPHNCWGSYDTFEGWIKKGGWYGIYEKKEKDNA